MSSPLDRRAAAIDALTHEQFDVVVVGGGITGVGALLDATSRGLRAGLIERDDLAVGTSSRSSKLIHGGLRYLEQLRFGLVREALAERATLLRVAGDLVRLEPFAVPLYGSPLQVPYLGAGLVLYGLLGAGRASYHRPGSIRRLHPTLRPAGLRGGFVYRDGVEDDARLVVAVCRTAIERGASAVTRVRATGLLREGGRCVGIEARDELGGRELGGRELGGRELGGRELAIRARAVIDATGATGGQGGPFAADAGVVAVTPSLGIHIVVERARIPGEGGLTIRVPGRVVFLVPWGRRWVIGTTDHPYTGPTERPTAPASAVDEVLAAVNATLDVGLTRAEVIATFAGIRPLAGGTEGSTVKASREHVISQPIPGLISVRGGKYTTYRLIAAQLVDAALGASGVSGAARTRSATADLRLVTASGERGAGVADAAPALIRRYGGEAAEVLALGRERGLLQQLHPDADYLEVEVAWAVERELALSLDDILARRLRLAIEARDHGAGAAARVAAIAGPLLGWDAARQALEVTAYSDSAAREYGVP